MSKPIISNYAKVKNTSISAQLNNDFDTLTDIPVKQNDNLLLLAIGGGGGGAGFYTDGRVNYAGGGGGRGNIEYTNYTVPTDGFISYSIGMGGTGGMMSPIGDFINGKDGTYTEIYFKDPNSGIRLSILRTRGGEGGYGGGNARGGDGGGGAPVGYINEGEYILSRGGDAGQAQPGQDSRIGAAGNGGDGVTTGKLEEILNLLSIIPGRGGEGAKGTNNALGGGGAGGFIYFSTRPPPPPPAGGPLGDRNGGFGSGYGAGGGGAASADGEGGFGSPGLVIVKSLPSDVVLNSARVKRILK